MPLVSKYLEEVCGFVASHFAKALEGHGVVFDSHFQNAMHFIVKRLMIASVPSNHSQEVCAEILTIVPSRQLNASQKHIYRKPDKDRPC